MTETQATLHQLQRAQSDSSGDPLPAVDYVHSVEFVSATPLARWLKLSGLFTFLFAFSAHQFYLFDLGELTDQTPGVVETLATNEQGNVPSAGSNLEQAVAASQSPIMLPPNSLAESDPQLTQEAMLEQTKALALQAEQERELSLLRQQQIDLLYKNAAIALSKDRLMTPESDNAVHYFQAMLDLDATEPRALSGLQQVAKRYKAFAISLAKKGDITAAAKMLERAETVAPQRIGLGDLIAQMPAAHASEPNSAIERDRDITQTAIESPEVKSSVVRSSNGKADDAKFLARKYIAAGQARDAALLLSGFMPQSATDGEFVELLHQAYLNSNQSAEALKLRVTLQGTLPSYHIAKMQAAEFIQSGRPAEAIAVLEKNLPSYEQDSSYYGLLAGLYYRVQRYADAEQAYEKLLAVAPETGSYWLGYAVALDAQANVKALGAFKKATLTLPAQDAARQYVEQRVRELGGG